MVDLFLSTFITLFIVIDPLGCGPIYASFTQGVGDSARRAMAIRATIVSGLILLSFALFGEKLLGVLNIKLDSFRIAGGIMLFFIAVDMVFEKRTQRREARAQKMIDETEIEDVSVFPMAIPMIAGPGSIASLLLLVAENDGLDSMMVILAALAAILLLTLVVLLAAGPLMRLLGARTEAVITRLLGVLLAALAAQFVMDGITSALQTPLASLASLAPPIP